MTTVTIIDGVTATLTQKTLDLLNDAQELTDALHDGHLNEDYSLTDLYEMEELAWGRLE